MGNGVAVNTGHHERLRLLGRVCPLHPGETFCPPATPFMANFAGKGFREQMTCLLSENSSEPDEKDRMRMTVRPTLELCF